ncbi:MAG: VWA domain-containing protein [Acidobacteriota bacterium]|nr:VWA domain-containing protein [Acidobacteriota bacterium]
MKRWIWRFAAAAAAAAVVLIPVFSAHVFAQQQQGRCLTAEDAKKIIDSINAPPAATATRASENIKLREELLKMQDDRREMNLKVVENWEKNQKLLAESNRMSEAQMLRLCQIVRENGWLTKESVGEDAAAAALAIVRNNKAFELQKEFFPVLEAAVQKGLAAKSNLAWLIDTIRLGSGHPQIFGTQSYFRDEMIYLYPIQNEDRLDRWRALYGLQPMADFIKDLEVRHQTVVIKSPRLPAPPVLKQQPAKESGGAAGEVPDLTDDENEVLKVETQLVNLNVRVLNEDSSPAAAAAAAANLNLKKEDFEVLEDGQPQEISFFSTTDQPFDLILLLDLSGSLKGKQDLIIESSRRFIQAARPSDRIAIVTFTHEAQMVADLTADKKVLLEKVKTIKAPGGGSKVWDALKFAYDKIVKTRSAEQRRRSAVVFMTDGVDNSLYHDLYKWLRRNTPDPVTGKAYGLNPPGAPSETTFTELLETVRQNETTIFPIYLEGEILQTEWYKKAVRQGRKTLEMLGEETGGQNYYAKKITDLNGIYEKIIGDLSQVYSLGYESKSETRGGEWRSLSVKIKNHPKLVARTKRGYYAR